MSVNRDVRDKRHKHTYTDRLTLKQYHHSGSSTEIMRTLGISVYFIKSYNIVDIETFYTREREGGGEGERERREKRERERSEGETYTGYV